MSSRSVPRGSAAARSIRLALRASSIVATSRPSLARWVFRCRGNLATKSAMIPSLTCSIPPIPPLHPARSSVGSTAASVTQGQTDGWQGAYGIKYLERAAVAYSRLGANLYLDAIYAGVFEDAGGKALEGSNHYRLRF